MTEIAAARGHGRFVSGLFGGILLTGLARVVWVNYETMLFHHFGEAQWYELKSTG